MPRRLEVEKFLRAAVKTGLRMQHSSSTAPAPRGSAKGEIASDGVATLRRIKASLRKRTANSQ